MCVLHQASIHCRRNPKHDGDVQEIEKHAADRAPEELDVTSPDALAKEHAVMVVLLDTHITVLAVVRVVVRFKKAQIAPNFVASCSALTTLCCSRASS